MRVSGLTILHYGADYVSYAIRSVYDHVDVHHVVYTPTPSHGHQTIATCPETKEQLLAQVLAHDPQHKIRWHEVDAFRWEGQHRDYALSLCQGDLALVVDCDEVWDGEVLDQALKTAWDGEARDLLVSCLTLWRSFNWICRDDMQPVRVIKPSGHGIATFPLDEGRFWHFGYAVTDVIAHYKWLVHGHLTELRPDWFAEKWDPWPPVQDVHPTGCGPWNPERFDKEKLPKLMRTHPFYDLDIIR